MSETNSTRKCTTCKSIKPCSEFYKSVKSADGMQSSCKLCQREYAQISAPKRSQYQSEYQPEYRNSEAGKLSKIKYRAKYETKNPFKCKAHNAVKKAVEGGHLTKPDNCESCAGAGIIHGHHNDYSLPLEVRWLCQPCHKAWHLENGQGLNG